MLPLDGLRVLEYGETCMASYCGRLLADAGAEVVKMETLEGDPVRLRGPFPGDLPNPENGGLFLTLNVNKRSVCLDLDQNEGRDSFETLLSWAHILITDCPAARTEKLALKWPTLHQRHPQLSVASITYYGESGPYRDYIANDHVVYNTGGLAYATPGMPDHVEDPRVEPPLRPSTPLAELIAGATGAIAVMLSQLLTLRDGLGRYIEVSAQEAVANMMYRDVENYSYGKVITGRRPVQLAKMPNTVMPCKDGFVTIAVPYDHMWQPFVQMIGSPDWADLEVFSDSLQRATYWDALYPLLLEWTMRFTGEEIMRTAQKFDIPCYPAFSVSRVLESRHEKERGYFWEVSATRSSTAKIAGSPFIFSRTPLYLRRVAPRLGEHTEEVLREAKGSLFSAPVQAKNMGQSDGSAPHRLPLEGVRVVDFGQVVSIPISTQLLGWMGADVIIVETRKRLLSRSNPPFAYGRQSPNVAGSFNALATNKRSVTLNLTTSEGLTLARDLIRTADVVVDNFTTGTMEKLGLGYEQLRELRPDLVVLSAGGFGRTGEMASSVALHSSVNMVSGFATITGYAGERPRIMGTILPDVLSGLYSCMAVLEGLHHRQRTGEGQFIDFSMSEVFSHLMPETIFDYCVNGREPELLGNRDRTHAPQGIYRCKGWDAWVGISITEERQWMALCTVLGHPDLHDPRFATKESRRTTQDELDAIITSWTKRHERQEVVRLMQEAGVPAGASYTAKDLLNDPHLMARGFVWRVNHPEAGRRRMLGCPWRISDMSPIQVRRAPLIGEHTAEVLQGLLNISPKELSRLESMQVTF